MSVVHAPAAPRPSRPAEAGRIVWPQGRDFAFTMFDDTDFAELGSLREIYAVLADLGLFTTKSVWPIAGRREPVIGGATCEQEDYLRWVLDLQGQGFEIAMHNVAYSTSAREDTIRGFDRFRELFGHDPHTLANHASNHEGIYWGEHRLTGIHRPIYNVLTRNRRKGVFAGHVAGNPLFWGDVCRDRVRYVRNFVYNDPDTLAVCPEMPYHDPARPYVKAWFASAQGPRLAPLLDTLRPERIERVARQGGACIVYTHLGEDFHAGGRVDPRFRETMTRLSKMNGWFVPVYQLLDTIVEQKGVHHLSDPERRRLERRWLWDQVRSRAR